MKRYSIYILLTIMAVPLFSAEISDVQKGQPHKMCRSPECFALCKQTVPQSYCTDCITATEAPIIIYLTPEQQQDIKNKRGKVALAQWKKKNQQTEKMLLKVKEKARLIEKRYEQQRTRNRAYLAALQEKQRQEIEEKKKIMQEAGFLDQQSLFSNFFSWGS